MYEDSALKNDSAGKDTKLEHERCKVCKKADVDLHKTDDTPTSESDDAKLNCLGMTGSEWQDTFSKVLFSVNNSKKKSLCAAAAAALVAEVPQ